MAALRFRTLLNLPRKLANESPTQLTPDQVLLERFLNDQDDQAFEALMQRHLGMVVQVCRRILNNAHDAEDACQAVFLVMARKAYSIRNRSSIASWLHGTARNIAHKMHVSLVRRSAREDFAACEKRIVSEPEDISWREVQRIVDEELDRLPKIYQDALVLCYLGGRTQEEAAVELGWTLGTLRGRLERGREMLRGRLTRRGVTGAATLAIAVLLPSVSWAALSPALISATAKASVPIAAGSPIPSTISAPVAMITREALRISLWAKLTTTGLIALGVLVLGFGIMQFAEPQTIADSTPVLAVTTQLPDKGTEVWLESSQFVVPNAHLWTIAFSPDGKQLASGSKVLLNQMRDTGILRVWDVATQQILYSHETPHPVRCVTFSPDGTKLATAEHDGMTRLRNSYDGTILLTLRGHQIQGDAVAYSADGKTVATTGWDQTVRLWDTTTGTEIRALTGHRSQVFTTAFSTNGESLASAGVDNTVKVWNPANGEALFTMRGHKNTVHWLAFSPTDKNTLASASWDNTVKLWNTQTGKLTSTLRGHSEPVLAVAFSPDGKSLVSSAGKPPMGRTPGEVILWDLAAQMARSRFTLPDRVYGIAYSPNGDTLALACWDGTVRLYQCHRDDKSLEASTDKLTNLKFEQAPPEIKLKKEYAENYHTTFKETDKEGVLSYGPEAGECVKFESNGLRITLPTKYPRIRPGTGIVTEFGLKGDFEITASFRVLKETTTGWANVRVIVVPEESAEPDVWHKPSQNRAGLGRESHGQNVPGQFNAHLTKWNINVPKDEFGNTDFSQIETQNTQRTPTMAKQGRLRLVRHGVTLYFFMSEDHDQAFTLIHQEEFTGKQVKNVRLLASTGGPNASFDVLLSDLQIRADAFVKQLEGTIPLPVTTPELSPRRDLQLLLLILVPTLLVLLALGVSAFFYLRLRQKPNHWTFANIMNAKCPYWVLLSALCITYLA